MKKSAYELIGFIILITVLIIILINFLNYSISGFYLYNIQGDYGYCDLNISCGFSNWEENNVYCLNESSLSEETCFNITANNITIDCNNWENEIIYGNQDSEEIFYGIFSDQNLTKIKNCQIKAGESSEILLQERRGIYLLNNEQSELNNLNISFNSEGIHFENNSGNSINNTLISSNYLGIYIQNSHNNTLNDITTNSNDFYGFYISSSSQNNITNLTSNNNSNYGIYIRASSNNQLKNILSNYNYNGIRIISASENNKLDNITTRQNEYYGIYLDNSSYNNLTNIVSDLCLKGDGISLRSNSTNNKLVNISTNSNSYYGVYFDSSPNNQIENITSNSNSLDGIHLRSNSNNNKISLAILYSNLNNGIKINLNSNNNILNDINSSNNTFNGIQIISNTNNSLTNTTTNNNELNGVYLTSTTNNTLENITSIDNDYGLYLLNSYNNTIRKTNLTNNTYNFYIYGDTYISFNNNIDTSNIVNYNKKIYYNYSIIDYIFDQTTTSDAGIFICANCSNITIKDIALNSRNIAGIYLINTTNSSINNISSSLNEYGIILLTSNNNTLKNITTEQNEIGLILSNSHNNNLYNITSKENTLQGIQLSSSSNNNLTKITIKNNTDLGILLYQNSNNNRFTDASLNQSTIQSINSTQNNFSNINVSNNFNIDYIISSYSSILWNFELDSIINLESLEMSENIEFGKDYIFVNSTNLPEIFNKTAEISLDLSNVNITNPKPLIDGSLCSECIVENYTNESSHSYIVFFVPHFSNYSITQSTCGDGYCAITQNCSTCPEDCGECPSESDSTSGDGSLTTFQLTPQNGSEDENNQENTQNNNNTTNNEENEEDNEKTDKNGVFSSWIKWIIITSIGFFITLIMIVSVILFLKNNNKGDIIIDVDRSQVYKSDYSTIKNQSSQEENNREKLNKTSQEETSKEQKNSTKNDQSIIEKKIRKETSTKNFDINSIKDYIQSKTKDPKKRINYYLESGVLFLKRSDLENAKKIYSFIFNEYKNIRSHDRDLYKRIIKFRKSLK
jgi:parallel beta-helix repeat protein